MSYHNIRDKFGRFTKAVVTKTKEREKEEKTSSKETAKSILNVFLLDDTASMLPKAQATVDGFNKILSDTIAADQAAGIVSFFAFSKFGEENRQSWSVGTITPLVCRVGRGIRHSGYEYNPNCQATAIWSAIINIGSRTEEYLKTLPTGTKVVFTIFTDGQNNDGTHLVHTAKKFVQNKQKEGWVINFIGAGEQPFVERMSNQVGIFASNTLSYSNDSKGTRSAMHRMSDSRVVYTKSVASGTATTDGFFSND